LTLNFAEGKVAMSTPEERVADLVARFGAADACPARLLCDDHPADTTAFTLVEPDLTAYDLTYGELRERSARLAAALAELGVGPGDAVATLTGKSVELVVTLMAIWRRGAVHVPLFTAFAPAAITMRLVGSGAKLVVVDTDQRGKLDPSDDVPPDAPWRVVTVGDGARGTDLRFDELAHSPAGGAVEPVVTGPDAPFIMIFTSGTTGSPKGVPVPVRALAHMVMYLEFGYDATEEDVYWNAADPGWAYGLYYAIVAPLAARRRSILLRAGFSPELTWRVFAEFGVTNYAAAPTVYRALRNSDLPGEVRLRCASSAGEPLTPDLLPWAEGRFGIPIRDHYGQTELGMVVANGWHPGVLAPVKPGSMGTPLPGHNVVVLLNDGDEAAPTGVGGLPSTAPRRCSPSTATTTNPQGPRSVSRWTAVGT
jgi:acetyl-CoA synthetase